MPGTLSVCGLCKMNQPFTSKSCRRGSDAYIPSVSLTLPLVCSATLLLASFGSAISSSLGLHLLLVLAPNALHGSSDDGLVPAHLALPEVFGPQAPRIVVFTAHDMVTVRARMVSAQHS